MFKKKKKKKKASQQEAPYFLTMLMTCALPCATKIDMEKLFWNAILKEKTLTIYVSVYVVASDIPSVMNSTITVKRWQLTQPWV